MNEERLEQLVWEEIDGTITPEDRALLQASLRDQPWARDLERGVVSLSRILDEVEEVEPPRLLRQGIHEAIASSQQESGRVIPLSARERQQIHFQPGLRYGYLAAGLILGVLGYHLVSRTVELGEPLDPSQLQGAMAVLAPQSGRGLVIGLAPLSGSLALSRDGDLVLADLQLDHGVEVELIFERQEGKVTLRRLEQSGSAARGIEIGAGRLSLVVSGGERLRAVLEIDADMGAPLDIRVVAGGEVVVHRSVALGELPDGS